MVVKGVDFKVGCLLLFTIIILHLYIPIWLDGYTQKTIWREKEDVYFWLLNIKYKKEKHIRYNLTFHRKKN